MTRVGEAPDAAHVHLLGPGRGCVVAHDAQPVEAAPGCVTNALPVARSTNPSAQLTRRHATSDDEVLNHHVHEGIDHDLSTSEANVWGVETTISPLKTTAHAGSQLKQPGAFQEKSYYHVHLLQPATTPASHFTHPYSMHCRSRQLASWVLVHYLQKAQPCTLPPNATPIPQSSCQGTAAAVRCTCTALRASLLKIQATLQDHGQVLPKRLR